MTADDQQRQNWREAFEKIGREQLRLRLEHRRGEYDGEYGREAERWLFEQDAKVAAVERKRFRTIRRWTVLAGITGTLAAIAAWISAWPILKQWIR
jgi:hypothetical protein